MSESGDRGDRPARSLLQRICDWAAIAGIATSILVAVHIFYRHIDSAPYLAVDDALGNISVTLSNLGRYGFQASPLQAFGGLRVDYFYNYGPWPFLAGAALDWLFGTSFVVQRSLHLVGLIITICIACGFFRRYSWAAAAAFTGFALAAFWAVQWPMVRPDIAVGVFLVAALAATTHGLLTTSRWSWLAAGFCVAGAVTTHQIAWIAVPWVFGMLLLSRWLARDDARIKDVWTSFAFLAGGGMVGGLGYLLAIGFQIGELVSFWLNIGKWLQQAAPPSYADTFMRHFDSAWNYMPRHLKWAALIAFAGPAAAAIPALFFANSRLGRQVLTLSVPVASLIVAHQMALGAYGNFHAGYVLPLHYMVAWSAGITVVIALLLVEAIAPRVQYSARLLATILIAVLLVVQAGNTVKRGSQWTAIASQMVPFSEYASRVLGIMPAGSSAWGGLIFGLGSGLDIHLVQSTEARQLAERFRPEARASIAPDFLVVNDQIKWETLIAVRQAAANKPMTGSFRLSDLLPDVRYGLVQVVEARPYGQTRIYRRLAANEQEGQAPSFAIYDTQQKMWGSRLGPALTGIEFVRSAPANLRLTLGKTEQGRANFSRRGSLLAGAYAIQLRISNGSREGVGVIVASADRDIVAATGDTDFPFAQTPYEHDERQVSLVVHHPGGELTISQLDASAEASFVVDRVRPVEFERLPFKGQPSALPGVEKWSITGGAIAEQVIDGRIAIQGSTTPWAYQLVSPPIPVPPNSRGALNLTIDQLQGKVQVGILDQRGNWLEPPADNRPLHFATGANRTVSIVVANDQDTSLRRFTVSAATLSLEGYGGGTYTDRLIRCYRPIRDNPECK